MTISFMLVIIVLFWLYLHNYIRFKGGVLQGAVKTDKGIETELAELLIPFRSLDKKKQVIFLSAAKGIISGTDKT